MSYRNGVASIHREGDHYRAVLTYPAPCVGGGTTYGVSATIVTAEYVGSEAEMRRIAAEMGCRILK